MLKASRANNKDLVLIRNETFVVFFSSPFFLFCNIKIF